MVADSELLRPISTRVIEYLKTLHVGVRFTSRGLSDETGILNYKAISSTLCAYRNVGLYQAVCKNHLQIVYVIVDPHARLNVRKIKRRQNVDQRIRKKGYHVDRLLLPQEFPKPKAAKKAKIELPQAESSVLTPSYLANIRNKYDTEIFGSYDKPATLSDRLLNLAVELDIWEKSFLSKCSNDQLRDEMLKRGFLFLNPEAKG